MSEKSLSERRAAAIVRGVGMVTPLFAERASNAELWDTEGRRYIDFAAGIAVVNTGHGHPKVIGAAREQLDHLRNLTDEQIRAIARSGGVVQICLYKHFLSDTDVATVADAVRHIKHVVELVGVDYVGIGSDFDGGGEIAGATSENQLINITKALIKEGFNDDEISKILGGNLLRVFRGITE